MAFTYHEHNGLMWSESDMIPVRHMFTGKLSGIGEYPYSTNPDPVWEQSEIQNTVRARWINLCEAGGFDRGLCFTHQVHGNYVKPVTENDLCIPPLHPVPTDCDGLVTFEKNVPLCVFTADCCPVILCDRSGTGAVAMHCGWKGTVRDMVASGVRALEDKGIRPTDILAAIGPCISVCHFETGPEVHEAVDALLGTDAEGTWYPEKGVEGKYMVDLKEVNRRRLIQLGIPAEQIDVSADCTICSHDKYWSHRYTHGVRGSQCAIISL